MGGSQKPWQLGIPSPEFWPDQGKGANYAMKKIWGKATVSIKQINESDRGEN
jgi:hypothetical protein